MSQLSFFSRADDPETSVYAAAKTRPSHQSRLIRIAAIVDQAEYLGATADDIYTTVAFSDEHAVRSTWHRAVSAALDDGLIVERGDTRLSLHGTPMRVFVTERWQR